MHRSRFERAWLQPCHERRMNSGVLTPGGAFQLVPARRPEVCRKTTADSSFTTPKLRNREQGTGVRGQGSKTLLGPGSLRMTADVLLGFNDSGHWNRLHQSRGAECANPSEVRRISSSSDYFSRATTKSGTHSRARLNSESGSGARAWRLCSA